MMLAPGGSLRKPLGTRRGPRVCRRQACTAGAGAACDRGCTTRVPQTLGRRPQGRDKKKKCVCTLSSPICAAQLPGPDSGEEERCTVGATQQAGRAQAHSTQCTLTTHTHKWTLSTHTRSATLPHSAHSAHTCSTQCTHPLSTHSHTVHTQHTHPLSTPRCTLSTHPVRDCGLSARSPAQTPPPPALPPGGSCPPLTPACPRPRPQDPSRML